MIPLYLYMLPVLVPRRIAELLAVMANDLPWRAWCGESSTTYRE